MAAPIRLAACASVWLETLLFQLECDAHKKFSVFAAVDEKGQAGQALRVEPDRHLSREFLSRPPEHSPIAVETSGHCKPTMTELLHRDRTANAPGGCGPHGAQVRQRCGRWLNPLSSMKTIVRPFVCALCQGLASARFSTAGWRLHHVPAHGRRVAAHSSWTGGDSPRHARHDGRPRTLRQSHVRLARRSTRASHSPIGILFQLDLIWQGNAVERCNSLPTEVALRSCLPPRRPSVPVPNGH